MRDHLRRIFGAAIAACDPARVLPAHLPEPPPGRTLLLAVGKAAAAMAAAAEARWPAPLSGLVVVPHGSGARPVARLERIEAAHPVPDEASLAAAGRLLALARTAGPEDLVLVLLSGGASALACLPGEGLSLAEKSRLTEALLRSGAPIGQINCVRRHLSRIKGGRLALAAAPARLVTLAVSDVVGDPPEDIGSGPTAPDPTTVSDAREVLRRYGLACAAGWSESAKEVPGDYQVVAAGRHAMAAAAAEARRIGYRPMLLGETVGEAGEAGADHAARALVAPPATALISGGEVLVTLDGAAASAGGPNQEYALAAAIRLAGSAGISGLACDSDGIDGKGIAAGAFFDGGTTARAAEDAEEALRRHRSGPFFAALGDLHITGPTGTNVNDLRIILTSPKGRP